MFPSHKISILGSLCVFKVTFFFVISTSCKKNSDLMLWWRHWWRHITHYSIANLLKWVNSHYHICFQVRNINLSQGGRFEGSQKLLLYFHVLYKQCFLALVTSLMTSHHPTFGSKVAQTHFCSSQDVFKSQIAISWRICNLKVHKMWKSYRYTISKLWWRHQWRHRGWFSLKKWFKLFFPIFIYLPIHNPQF